MQRNEITRLIHLIAVTNVLLVIYFKVIETAGKVGIGIQRTESMYTVQQKRKCISKSNTRNYSPILDMLHEYNKQKQIHYNGKVQQTTRQPAGSV
jgi:hypothetical protein